MTRSKRTQFYKDNTKDRNIILKTTNMSRSKKSDNKGFAKDHTTPKTRHLVECKCILHCRGSKLVDPRTFKKHQQELERFRAITSESQHSARSKSIRSNKVDIRSSSTLKGKERIKSVDRYQNSSDDYFSDDPMPIDEEPIDVPKK